MSGMYPPTRPELTGEPKDAFAVHMEVDTQVREYLIAVEQVKIMQAKLKACYEKSGPNHFEDCKELRETLWEKLNTPNYGAPGPSRSVRARDRAPSRRSPTTLPSRKTTLTPPLLPTRRAVVQVHDQQQLRASRLLCMDGARRGQAHPSGYGRRLNWPPWNRGRLRALMLAGVPSRRRMRDWIRARFRLRRAGPRTCTTHSGRNLDD